ncbi:peptidase M10A and M12B matrixin and adamalysin [Halomarina salina]|uniref:Peptidase M10A and M12B matrixin and adamalysin n=1 Tax=Halomarina salina TaxID=1872699 RepID=A0ABD5RPP3_9EURY|nr:hypothetical protein [Halomarina salina]
MRRRSLLLKLGAAGAVGSAGVAATLVGDIEVRWWATPKAAQHSGLRRRVEAYLEHGFDDGRLSMDVSYGGVTSFPTENAYRLVTGGAWPRRLLSSVTDGTVDPVDGVNLLVTDSSMRRAPTGAGIPYVAAVGGARHIVRAPDPDESDAVVPDRLSTRTVQILLHECGHALGLRHDHGSIREADTAAVVSPMVSGYAWASGPVRREQFDFEANRCGRPYPPVNGRDPRLLMQFDDCERRGLYRYRLPDLSATPVDRPSVGDLLDRASLSACGTCTHLARLSER